MKKRSLLWRIFPSYLIVTLVALLAVAALSSAALRRFCLDQIAVALTARARLTGHQLAAHLTPPDPAAIDRICKISGELTDTRITVMNAFGKVLGDSNADPAQMPYHHDRPEFIAARQGGVGQALRYSDTLDQQMMYIAVATDGADPPSAVVRCAVPVSAIDRQLRAVYGRIAAGGLLIALLAAGLSWWVARRLSRPLQVLQAGAQRFAGGDLAHRVPVYDTVEFGTLAEAMNHMATQLDERINSAIRQRMEMWAILSSMGEGVVALDLEERIIQVNRCAVEILGGGPPEKLVGRTLTEVIRNSDLQHLVDRAQKEDQCVEADLTIHQPEAKTLYVRCPPLRDQNSRRIGLLLVMSDVTRLRRLENMRRDFAANVSHEIKTPLTAIKGFVETLYHGEVEDRQEVRRFLGIIEKHVQRLAAIIDDLIKLSRIERDAESREIVLSNEDVGAVVEAAAGLCRQAAEARSIRIASHLPETPVIGRISAPLLEQALVNLIDNAVKYSPEGTEVEVDLSLADGGIRIRVSDQGPGIARQHLPRIFERFYRVDKARSRKLGGTGLGLAIVKHIVQAHGGEVTADSAPGRGTRFTITLPDPDRQMPPREPLRPCREEKDEADSADGPDRRRQDRP